MNEGEASLAIFLHDIDFLLVLVGIIIIIIYAYVRLCEPEREESRQKK